MSLRVLFEDEDLIAFDKPSGLLVHPIEEGLAPRARSEETCLSLARDHCGRHVFPIHRLDRATSGVVLFAKSSETASSLGRQMERQGFEKEYLALVRGWMMSDLDVNHPVWNEIRTQRLPAFTSFVALDRFEIPVPSGRHETSRYSLVRARPRTGRYHQIRQHLKHLSHPIIGDTAHGDGFHNQLFRERHGLHRLFLHAAALELTHPVRGARLRVEAELPEPLRALVEQLRVSAPARCSDRA